MGKASSNPVAPEPKPTAKPASPYSKKGLDADDTEEEPKDDFDDDEFEEPDEEFVN
jgi:hypothetical protein